MSSIKSFFSSSSIMPQEVEIFQWQTDRPSNAHLSLVNLFEVEIQLADPTGADKLLAYLSPRESDFFARFTFPKRKREWLGGRLATKYAVLSLLQMDTSIEHCTSLTILPKENGTPEMYSAHVVDYTLPAISISHSEQYAVAMAADAQFCGIDIQKVSNTIQRVSDRFCNKHELTLLQDHIPQLSENEQLTLLWSAKEALKKSLLHDQPVIFKGVVLASLDVDEFFTLYLTFPGAADKAAKVTVSFVDDYMLAYTIAGSINA